MKFLFLILLASTAVADPAPVSGIYRFHGELRSFGRKTVDVVDTRMPDAQVRLVQLRQNGATCQNVQSNIIRCLKLHPEIVHPPQILARFADRNRGLQIEFGPRRGNPVEITRGEVLVEWKIPQAVRWNDGVSESFRHLELRNGPQKIVVPSQKNPESPLWLNTLDGTYFVRIDAIATTESQWRWHEDMVEVLIRP